MESSSEPIALSADTPENRREAEAVGTEYEQLLEEFRRKKGSLEQA